MPLDVALLTARIPNIATLVGAFTSPPPVDPGAAHAFATPWPASSERPSYDLSGLLDDATAGDDAPETMPSTGLFDRLPADLPMVWLPDTGAPVAAPVPAAALRVYRSAAEPGWIRLANSTCIGILYGEVRIDVRDHEEWLFCDPAASVALRLRGGWVLVTEHGAARMYREVPSVTLPELAAPPDRAAWAELATLDPLVDEECEGTIDRVGTLLRFGVPPRDARAEILRGGNPPVVPVLRAWAATVEDVAWDAVLRVATERARALLGRVSSERAEEIAAWACHERDVLESTWCALAISGRGSRLLEVLVDVDDVAERRGLDTVEIDPVPMRVQHEASCLARWWGRT